MDDITGRIVEPSRRHHGISEHRRAQQQEQQEQQQEQQEKQEDTFVEIVRNARQEKVREGEVLSTDVARF